jgi:hypothetical protein
MNHYLVNRFTKAMKIFLNDRETIIKTANSIVVLALLHVSSYEKSICGNKIAER